MSIIGLSIDPSPDLMLEINSLTRRDHRPLYAALQVEPWRFDGSRLHIHGLRKDAYVATGNSEQFPG
ncbi:MAG TPA: hypothetical protein DDY14_08645 [Chromatiaceae bacterium]|jgi:Uma2 family endonuclease|nr:MAG: hypothetical protein N838_29730 [Thiohalocapsa sp. PB-PSB1]HBG95375.1 hypothetical protein [Chromatiaceae bacterium]HCS91859.1 hypothetical protein [Chromatiaceae bacterium]